MRIVLIAVLALLATKPTGVKESRFFKVDLDTKKVVSPLDRVAQAQRLDFISVSTDQPQYWPNEKVFLKLIAPGAPKQKFKATLQKRDAASKSFDGELDAFGVAVLPVMDGEASKNELGEYRIDVDIGALKGNSTFAVVEGTLGALSFAYDWKKLTTAAQLETEKGAWFLGNASGAGSRWGNGLSFKNELRIDNKPYEGVVDIHSRCMLPGCNGTWAGKSLLKFEVKKGLVQGTLDVGGHSGPFQIEIITDKGSLRYQFEGSSHVERDMVPVSGGVSFLFRAGLAPYDKTEQVPGRQIFVEKQATGHDAFEAQSIVAKGGKLTVTAKKKIKDAVLVVYAPNAEAKFDKGALKQLGSLEAGASITVEVPQPYAFAAMGGFVDGVFAEGWLMAFRPAELQLALDAPAGSAPKQTITVAVQAKDGAGKGVRVSGILEAYDNRVASKSALLPLASAIGDAVRNASHSVSSWRDNTGIQPDDDEIAEERESKPSKNGGGIRYGSGNGSAGGLSSKDMAAPKPTMAAPMKKMAMGARAAPPPSPTGKMQVPEEEVPEEAIREGEKKVVFCARVETDASGAATANVTLPPQMGRLVLRFVAVSGLDHAAVQKDVDSSRPAAADLRAPKVFVPGAKLTLPVNVTNGLNKPINVSVVGGGVEQTKKAVAPGGERFNVAWAPTGSGVITATVNDGTKVVDRRELRVDNVGEQPVTYSRLEIVGSTPIAAAADEKVTVYNNAGELMRGVTMNLFTTMESWFGHAEALSAKVAASSVALAAIDKGLLQDDGMRANLVASIDKTVRDLDTAFSDASGLMKPYPGLPANPLWSGWVAKNLHDAAQALSQAKLTDVRVTESLASSKRIAEKIDAALVKQGFKLEEQFEHDSKGNDVIPVEIDGKVVYKVLTDDAVTKWAADRLKSTKGELDLSKAYDTMRFLKAFERVGVLQYMTDIARALYQKGDMATFAPLYKAITRGMILAQEPGMVQGPALLGGVYSTPMALVRFLELQLAMGNNVSKVARVDKKGVVRFDPASGGEAFAKAAVSKVELSAGGEAMLTVELDGSRDPLEYYALVAVPSTTSIKQTVDILSDYRGQLIYGQQGMGAQVMQLVAVPFRGSRKLELLLEGAFAGVSPGMVVIRHVDNPALVGTVAVPAVTVR